MLFSATPRLRVRHLTFGTSRGCFEGHLLMPRFDPSLPPNRPPSLRGREETELSDVVGSPSPRPSPGGRGRSSGVTCTCNSFAEWTARCLRLSRLASVNCSPSLMRISLHENVGNGSAACQERPSAHGPKTQGRSNQGAN